MTDSHDTASGFVLDKRGVSEVIGSVLVFGIVIMLLSIMQMQAIPNANEEIEYKHSQELQQDMTRLQESILRTAIRGDSEAVSVKLGTAYPTRLLFYNPPPAQGSLRTLKNGNITISGVTAENRETDDYLNRGKVNITTHTLAYRPGYNLYSNAPTTMVDNTVLAQDYSSDTIVDSQGKLVDGRTITLATLGGNYTRQGVGAESVSVEPVSAPARTVTVTNADSQKFSVTVPTRLSEDVWVQEVLNNEIDDDTDGTVNAEDAPEKGDTCADIGYTERNADNDRFIADCSFTENVSVPNATGTVNQITLTFEPDTTYRLRLSKVGFGDNNRNPPATYLTTVEGDNVGIPETGIQRLVLEVRDAYNAPVTGETVTLHVDGAYGSLRTQDGETGQTVDVKTNADGEAVVIYESEPVKQTSRVPINATFDSSVDVSAKSFDPRKIQNAQFDVTVNDIGDVATGTPPTVTIKKVKDKTGDDNIVDQLTSEPDAVFDVKWTADDGSGELESATLRLIRTDSGRVVDRAEYDLEGESRVPSETTRLRENDAGTGVKYRIELIVRDEQNNVVTRTETETSG